MNMRRYRGETDVALLQTFNAEAIAKTDGCGYLHPGDIAHRLSNGNKLLDPADVLSIWEEDGSVIAWVLASPRHTQPATTPRFGPIGGILDSSEPSWSTPNLRLSDRCAETGSNAVDWKESPSGATP